LTDVKLPSKLEVAPPDTIFSGMLVTFSLSCATHPPAVIFPATSRLEPASSTAAIIAVFAFCVVEKTHITLLQN